MIIIARDPWVSMRQAGGLVRAIFDPWQEHNIHRAGKGDGVDHLFGYFPPRAAKVSFWHIKHNGDSHWVLPVSL